MLVSPTPRKILELLFFFFFFKKSDLGISKSDRMRGKDQEMLHLLLYFPNGHSRSQEFRTPFGFPVWVTWTQPLGPTFAAF